MRAKASKSENSLVLPTIDYVSRPISGDARISLRKSSILGNSGSTNITSFYPIEYSRRDKYSLGFEGKNLSVCKGLSMGNFPPLNYLIFKKPLIFE
jgi:hypothetical protein